MIPKPDSDPNQPELPMAENKPVPASEPSTDKSRKAKPAVDTPANGNGGAGSLTEPSSKYLIIDGQHRLLALHTDSRTTKDGNDEAGNFVQRV